MSILFSTLLLACNQNPGDQNGDDTGAGPVEDTADTGVDTANTSEDTSDTSEYDTDTGADTGDNLSPVVPGVYHAIYDAKSAPRAGFNAWRVQDETAVTIGGAAMEAGVSEGKWEVVRRFSDAYGDCTYTGTVVHTMPLEYADNQEGTYQGEFFWACPDVDVESWTDNGTFAAVLIKPYDTGSSGLALVGETVPLGDNEMSLSVKILDGYAYVARWGDGLRIYDVTDPASIVPVGHLPVTEGELWYDVELLQADGRTFAMVSGGYGGTAVIDVTDPAYPNVVTRIDEPYEVHDVTLDGTTAFLSVLGYVDGEDSRIDILDVSDPTAPEAIGSWNAAVEAGFTWVQEAVVSGGEMWVTSWDTSVAVVDISDLSAPALVEVLDLGLPSLDSVVLTDAPGQRVAVVGGEGYGAHLAVIDADASSPTWGSVLGEVQFRDEVSIHSLALAGGTLVAAAWYQDGLRIVDIADPTAPVVVAYANTWDSTNPAAGQVFYEGAGGVTVDEDFIYVADSYRDLLVFELE